MFDSARLTVKLGSYGVAPGTALHQPAMLTRVQAFRRQIGAQMMALDKLGIAKQIIASHYHISRKIDGEFSVLVVQDGDIMALNPGGTIRYGAPYMKEALELLQKAGITNGMIAGELYVHRKDDQRPRVHDVVRLARSPSSQKEVDSLHFAVFDFIEIDEEPVTEPYAEKWEQIQEVFGDGERVHPVETEQGSEKTVKKQFEQWVEKEGAEGVVVRSDNAGFFKIKPRHTLDVAVIGFAEGTGDRKGMIHDLLLAIQRADGSFQIMGRVGGGFSDQERCDFLSDLTDLVVSSEYAEVNSDRVAYQMVEPKLVAEISCLDLVSQTTRGGTIDRMVLNWDPEKQTWETVRRLPLVSIISPQFIRFRDDKKVHPNDIAIKQLTDLVEIPLAEKSAKELELPASEVLRRKVATKTLKGATMVRKLLMWKTNKEGENSPFPAYVVHLTDYSPNRKTPLQREIRVSSSREQIGELWDALEEKFFVKGWQEVIS